MSKLWIFPWYMYVTNNGGLGGLIFERKCIFENKFPPQSRSCLLLKKGGGGGGLFSGGYGNMHVHVLTSVAQPQNRMN